MWLSVEEFQCILCLSGVLAKKNKDLTPRNNQISKMFYFTAVNFSVLQLAFFRNLEYNLSLRNSPGSNNRKVRLSSCDILRSLTVPDSHIPWTTYFGGERTQKRTKPKQNCSDTSVKSKPIATWPQAEGQICGTVYRFNTLCGILKFTCIFSYTTDENRLRLCLLIRILVRHESYNAFTVPQINVHSRPLLMLLVYSILSQFTNHFQ